MSLTCHGTQQDLLLLHEQNEPNLMTHKYPIQWALQLGITYANKLRPFIQPGLHMCGLSFTLKSWAEFHGVYECHFNMHGPNLKPTCSTISILNLYCLWATRHWWSVAAQTRSTLPYMLQLQSSPLFVKYLIHSFKIIVYGRKHVHIHTHMRNVVSLVWGSLRGQPQTVGPVTNSWTFILSMS